MGRMGIAMPRWYSKTLRVATTVVVTLLATTGCLLSRVGYGIAPTLARWELSDYVDLGPEQRVQLDDALRGIHEWHRRVELPVYAAIAREAAQRIDRGLQPSDIDWAESVFRARYDALTRHAAAQLVDLASTIEPDQIGPMNETFARSNEKFRSENLDAPRARRVERRIDEAIDQIEDWTGGLDRNQRRVLAAKVASLPETAAIRYAQRLARQRAIRTMLETQPPREELAAGLALWLIGWDAGRDAEQERIHLEWMRQSRRLVLDVDAMLTPKQRARASEELRDRASDSSPGAGRPLPAERSGERVEELDVRRHDPVEPGQLRIRRLDDVVLIRRVRPAAVPQAELAGRQTERLAGEGDPRPRAGQPGPEQRLDARPAGRPPPSPGPASSRGRSRSGRSRPTC